MNARNCCRSGRVDHPGRRAGIDSEVPGMCRRVCRAAHGSRHFLFRRGEPANAGTDPLHRDASIRGGAIRGAIHPMESKAMKSIDLLKNALAMGDRGMMMLL